MRKGAEVVVREIKLKEPLPSATQVLAHPPRLFASSKQHALKSHAADRQAAVNVTKRS